MILALLKKPQEGQKIRLKFLNGRELIGFHYCNFLCIQSFPAFRIEFWHRWEEVSNSEATHG